MDRWIGTIIRECVMSDWKGQIWHFSKKLRRGVKMPKINFYLDHIFDSSLFFFFFNFPLLYLEFSHIHMDKWWLWSELKGLERNVEIFIFNSKSNQHYLFIPTEWKKSFQLQVYLSAWARKNKQNLCNLWNIK